MSRATVMRRKPPAPALPEEARARCRNDEAERSVLGACLVDNGAVERACAILDGPHFYADAHARIFAACLRLRAKGSAVDTVTLPEELSRCGDLEAVGGPIYISGLVDGVPRSSNVEHYARIVRDHSDRRQGWADGTAYAAACTNGHNRAERTEAAAALYRAALQRDPESRRRVCSTAEALDDLAADAAKGPGRKIRTGFSALDEMTDGITEGQVATVVARMGVGKSAAASQVIVNGSLAGVSSVFFSLEMSRPQTVTRMLCQRLGMTRREIEEHAREGWRTLTEAEREARDHLARSVVVVDRGKSGIADLDASMIEATAILGRSPRLAVIDYLGLLGSGAKNLPLYQRVSEAAVDVKSFAKRHNVAVLLLSQAGRDPDPRRSEGAAEIGIDAARDSGQVEEAADYLLTLWREELSSALKPEDRAEVRGELSAFLCKNRQGPTGKFRLHFDAPTLRVRNWGVEA